MFSDSDRQRRLLDLLYGWAEYLDKCSESCKTQPHPGVTEKQYLDEIDAVMQLYQRVGACETFSHDNYQNVMREIENVIRTGGTSE